MPAMLPHVFYVRVMVDEGREHGRVGCDCAGRVFVRGPARGARQTERKCVPNGLLEPIGQAGSRASQFTGGVDANWRQYTPPIRSETTCPSEVP